MVSCNTIKVYNLHKIISKKAKIKVDEHQRHSQRQHIYLQYLQVSDKSLINNNRWINIYPNLKRNLSQSKYTVSFHTSDGIEINNCRSRKTDKLIWSDLCCCFAVRSGAPRMIQGSQMVIRRHCSFGLRCYPGCIGTG